MMALDKKPRHFAWVKIKADAASVSTTVIP
jgi:hypothetical protein